MRIVCAPDSFKESLTAAAAAAAMEAGIRSVVSEAEVDLCPVADGGEGTVEALTAATNGRRRQSLVTGPLGEPVEATWGQLGEEGHERPPMAVIEMAAASGLALVPPRQRDPTRTTTFGTGELLRHALDAGAHRIILGIGGSATCDGAAGAAQALGVRFFHDDVLLDQPLAGGMLDQVTRIDLAQRDPRLNEINLLVACDVTNPLTGPQGAARVYGPQKGATPAQVEQLERGLANLAKVGRVSLDTDIQRLLGAGAAGGFGGGAMALLGGELRRGIDLVLEAVKFDQRVADADLCLTGEGRLDGQTCHGKAVAGVGQMARRHDVPVIALAGRLGSGVERLRELGVTDYAAISEGRPVVQAMAQAAELLEAATAQAVRRFVSGLSHLH